MLILLSLLTPVIALLMIMVLSWFEDLVFPPLDHPGQGTQPQHQPLPQPDVRPVGEAVESPSTDPPSGLRPAALMTLPRGDPVLAALRPVRHRVKGNQW